MMHMVRNEAEFSVLGMEYELVPVVTEVPSAGRSASSLFRALREGERFSFLMEGDGRDVHGGRYAVMGFDPLQRFVLYGGNAAEGSAFLGRLRGYVDGAGAFSDPLLPPFSGGLFGFFAYEATAFFDDLFHCSPEKQLPGSALPLAHFFAPGVVAVLDRREGRILLIDYIETAEKNDEQLSQAYRSAAAHLGEYAGRIEAISIDDDLPPLALKPFAPTICRETFMERVTEAREAIRGGEAYQIVLSQRFETDAPEDALLLYDALCRENPSPYHFFFDSPDVTLVGASPEILVRVRNGRVISRPLAGTRRRGATPEEDVVLEAELRADAKERAEHVMLVDLARNDTARTCRPESVAVTEFMEVERFARVMHLASQVEGELRPGETPLDVLRTSFPAGTVSGAPKIRAMEIIAELEGAPRNSYAGAFCALDYGGDLDSCISIRTFSISGGKLHLQVGAGVVYDSDPAAEYEETLHKANALFRALGPTA